MLQAETGCPLQEPRKIPYKFKSLVLLGDFNTIVDGWANRVGSADRKRNPDFKRLLVNQYALDEPNTPIWNWSNSDDSYRSYWDRIIIRNRDKDSVGYPKFYIVLYTDHKFVTFRLTLDKLHRQGLGYRKLNNATLTYESFLNRVKELVKRPLTGVINNSRWWCTLIRTIRSESVRFSKQLSVDKTRIKVWLIRDLEKNLVSDDIFRVLVGTSVLCRLLRAKYVRQGLSRS